MTAVASVGANMHDNNMVTNIHGVALPSLQPTLNMKTSPTSIFKKSFEALAKVSTPENDEDVDDDDDDDDDDFDICDENSFNAIRNTSAPNRIGHFYDPPPPPHPHHHHHHPHLSNVTTPDINPCSAITAIGSGLGMIGPNLGSFVGEDDFSDHDSHYSADFEEDDEFTVQFPSLIASLPRRSQSPDVTKQLLDFAEMINADIKKFFGQKPGEEDSCDIYEDKWISSKSGRELYYADLLRIAHGESIETKCKSTRDKVSSSSYTVTPSTSSAQAAFTADNKDKFSGRLNKALGLGPLNELFEYGLRGFLSVNKSRTSAKKFKRLKLDLKKHEDIVPMNRRKLPESFWKQPGCIVSTSGLKSKQSTSSSSNCVDNLINSKTLDFSDLLESWTGEERGDFNRDISCSDVSTTSSE